MSNNRPSILEIYRVLSADLGYFRTFLCLSNPFIGSRTLVLREGEIVEKKDEIINYIAQKGRNYFPEHELIADNAPVANIALQKLLRSHYLRPVSNGVILGAEEKYYCRTMREYEPRSAVYGSLARRMGIVEEFIK